MSYYKKIVAIILCFAMLITSVPVNAVVYAADSTYSRINVQARESAIYQLIKEQFISYGQNIELVYNQIATAGDIVVYINGAETTYGSEGYGITVTDGIATVTAHTQSGAVYGLTDVLKQIEAGNGVSAVEPTQPFKEVRGLFVDCARKYFSVSWFENIIREMAWNGLNTLYISFSNDEGFRLLLDDMSLSFDNGYGTTVTYSDEFMSHMVDNPETVSDSDFLTERNANATDQGASRVVTNYDNNRYLTQSDMERILTYAKMYGVDIIPEFNSPGHFGQVLWYFPEYRITGTWYEDGQPHYGLDLTNTEAANFGKAFVKKYIDFFVANGCTNFCVGGDEYNKGNATNEQVAAYTNALVSYAESKGMTAYSWNDGQAAANNLLSESAIVNSWNGTSSYKSVNFNSQNLYYVLKGYEWKPNAQSLFETWTPLTYYGNVTATEEHTVGSALAIWCDVPNKETASYVLESMIPNIQAFGYRMWNYDPNSTSNASYSEFNSSVTIAPRLSEATVLSLAGYDISNIEVELPDPLTSSGDSIEGYQLVSFTPGVSSSAGWYHVYYGSNLIDGDKNSLAWTNAEQTLGSYIQVDIGSIQYIDYITITSTDNANDYCENANVEVSSDGIIWTKVGEFSGQSGVAVEESYDVNKSIRYIRVTITKEKSNWWQMAEISWSLDDTIGTTISDGTYIIAHNTNRAMTNSETSNGSNYGNDQGLGYYDVTVSENIASDPNSSSGFNDILEWTITKQEDGYYIQSNEGKYININGRNNITLSDNPENLYATIYNGQVQFSDGYQSINYFAQEGPIYSSWDESTTDPNNIHTLYKKIIVSASLSTQALYNVIIKARSYTSTGNVDDVYGDVEFESLEYELDKATEIYLSAYSDQDNYNKDLKQEELDAAVESLQMAMDALKLSNKTTNYIEIPVEILDFRADGVMFEYAQNTSGKGLYELLTDTKFGGLTYGNVSVAMPGELGDRITHDTINGWDEDTKRTGLMEDYLVDGKPVYKEATVDYVAKLIAKGYFDDLSSSVSGWNSNISSKITSLYSGYSSDTDTNSNLGDWTSTIAKTSTKANGGDLLWADITTCYDLSYYILNNMWRATDDTDGAETYNMTVTDRNIFRLLYNNDTGWYHLDATKEIDYVGKYIYNTDLITENTAETKFTPINGLGYESSSSFGDTTDTMEGVNSHFTVHASGSFVYNADENLYFYFDGDDDVYYYINGHLVMDIGGAHSHCDDELYLNTIAAEIGLEDGGIYTFDMFYAERHTTQNNLAFKSNIKVMDTMSTTSKGQFIASTGEEIAYGAIVQTGTEIAYSFDLMNMRSVNITDITFVDDSLGAHISPNSITLYDASLTNGATTDIDEDIKVYYRTYDRLSPNETGTINSSTPVEKTVDEIISMINYANLVDGSKTYMSIPTGSYVVDVETEEELKTLLALGISIDTQISVYGFKRIVTEKDRPYVNTVLSNAYYTSNGERHALNGVASQKLTVINSFEYPTDIERIVIDYGKPININIEDITDNIELNDNVTATFYGITPSGAHNQTRLTATSILGTELNTRYTTPGKKGAYTLLGETKPATDIQMQLTDFLSEKEVIYAAYEIVDKALDDTAYEKYYLLIAIEIYPATSVYYETDFADGVFSYSSGGWSEELDTTGEDTKEVQDSSVVGSGLTYGFDSSYDNDKLLSNGSSQKAIGAADTDNNTYYTVTTTTQFTFTGTGFDLISRTGAAQGLIKVTVTDSTTGEQKKKLSVLNKSESALELYQIPVVSIEDLDYGTYDVLIEVDKEINHTNPILAPLNRGGEFYFDAVKIHNPLMTDEAVAIYATDGEANAKLTEIRNMLIEAKDFDILDSANNINGAVFIDRDKQIVSDIDTYTQIGPNNELYLSPGYAIAFKIEADNLPSSVDIGAKIIRADAEATLSAVITKDGTDLVTNKTEKDISTATAQFIDLIGTKSIVDLFALNDETGKYETYIVLKNSSEAADDSVNQISITDLKISYGSNVQTADYSLVVNNAVYDVATTYMTVESKDFNVKSAEFEIGESKVSSYTTMTVVTEPDVDGLIVTSDWLTNPNAKLDVPTETSYVINENGDKVWTVKILLKYPGNRTYTVTGYIEEGYEGVQAKDSINTRIGGLVYEKGL